MLIIVSHSPLDSNLYRSRNPDDAGWTLTNQLLAAAVDVLRWLQWAKTKDGKKNRNRPEPIPRPGVARKKRVQPKVKAGPRSVVRQMLGRDRDSNETRKQRIADLFSGKAVNNDGDTAG